MEKSAAFVGSALRMSAVLESLWPATLTDITVANAVLLTVSTNQKINKYELIKAKN